MPTSSLQQLHLARTGQRPSHGSSERHFLLWLRALRNSDGMPDVRGRNDDGTDRIRAQAGTRPVAHSAECRAESRRIAWPLPGERPEPKMAGRPGCTYRDRNHTREPGGILGSHKRARRTTYRAFVQSVEMIR